MYIYIYAYILIVYIYIHMHPHDALEITGVQVQLRSPLRLQDFHIGSDSPFLDVPETARDFPWVERMNKQ